VIYEMVTGQLPFSGANPLDTLHAIAFEETRPITALRANLPPSLQRVVTRCLRKRPQDRYPDARELGTELKNVQREVESGISSRAPLALKLQEHWRTLQDRTIGEWLLPALMVVVGLALILAFMFGTSEGLPGSVITFSIIGLFVWRRIKNRRIRLARKFTAKARKLPEVRFVTLGDMRLTVVVDAAQAKTYVRVNAIVDNINSSMFFGEPFTVVIRDDAGEEDARALLSGPGVLYVRENDPALSAPTRPA